MTSRFAFAVGVVLALGCGTHRITFSNPSLQHQAAHTQHRTQAHGLGPLIVGGGGFFGILNEISPALVNYTGVVDTKEVCPNGFVEVSHGHNFGQSVQAAFISWLVVVNAYHQSDVEWRCLHAPS